MERKYSPSERRPARTVIWLSRDEVIEALKAYVESKADPVPDGHTFVWLPDPVRDGPQVTGLVVDEQVSDQEPSP